MKTVQEKNGEHAKAKEKFDELRDLTAKSAEVSKDAAKDDAYSTYPHSHGRFSFPKQPCG